MDITDIPNIIQNLQEQAILEKKTWVPKRLSGGTSSSIIALYDEDAIPRSIIKTNDPNTIHNESIFLNFYRRVDILPKLLYTDSEYRYLVYTFQEGETKYPQGNKRSTLKSLIDQLINRYEPYQGGYGYLDEPIESWKEYLRLHAEYAKTIIGVELPEEDHQLIEQLIAKKAATANPYLLHGDCGIHNFLYIGDTLAAIIDPTPVVGEPVYDLVYAFFSTPDGLEKETLREANRMLKQPVPEEVLFEDALIGLYNRLASCIKHHPADLGAYMKAWQSWKER